jgi:hypothetical protein
MLAVQLLRDMKSKTLHAYTRMNYSRKCRLYCVGAAKTGTHSIDTMFDESVKSQHEADDEAVIGKILQIAAGKVSAEDLTSFIRQRDKRICLDVDSSQLNFFLMDQLLEEFPQALFLLTIRDCYSWLNSFIDDSLRRQPSSNWIKLRDYRFRSDSYAHPPEEQALKDKGLYTLDGYLSYWAIHNHRVLTKVPEDRLMIVRTDEITDKAYEIADFAGLSRDCVLPQRSHAFKNPERFRVLNEIPREYLESKVSEHCGPMMARFFPEIRSIADARI